MANITFLGQETDSFIRQKKLIRAPQPENTYTISDAEMQKYIDASIEAQKSRGLTLEQMLKKAKEYMNSPQWAKDTPDDKEHLKKVIAEIQKRIKGTSPAKTDIPNTIDPIQENGVKTVTKGETEKTNMLIPIIAAAAGLFLLTQ